LYEAFAAGQASPLPELPVQYADYTVWQREFLSGEVLDKQLAYWKQHLAGAPASLDLPTDRPRPPVQTHRGARETVILPIELLDSVRQLSRQEGATLFMTLLAAFNVLLARYSGQQDVVIGTPIAGRNRAEVERLIGFFVNTLVMRTDVSGNPSFRELLARVRETAMGAYAHQDLPFEKLVEEIKPERDLSRNPLFQLMFVLQNVPTTKQTMGNIEATPFGCGDQSAKFDLSVFTSETTEGLRVTAIYSPDLFEAETIRRMLGHYQRLLEAAVATPNAEVFHFPMLSTEERQQILVDWNATDVQYPRELCLYELFAQQARQHPDRVAVVAGDRQMSYGELHQRSNQLARYLQKRGLGTEVLVGLMVSRTPDLLVAIMGVWKAGGAYIPLDPIYPKNRISTILEDNSARLLLTDEALKDTLPESAAERIYVDTDWSLIAQESADDLPRSAGPENLGVDRQTKRYRGRASEYYEFSLRCAADAGSDTRRYLARGNDIVL
jgi:non-ribosomal peptide synthetase component F